MDSAWPRVLKLGKSLVGLSIAACLTTAARAEDHPAPAPRSVELRVVDAESGRPVAGAVVERMPRHGSGEMVRPLGTSGTDGRLAVDLESPTTSLSLRVTHEHFVRQGLVFYSDAPRQLPEEVEIRLHRGERIGGVVVNEADEPVPHAAVLLSRFALSEDHEDEERQRADVRRGAARERQTWPATHADWGRQVVHADEEGRWQAQVSRADRVRAMAATEEMVPEVVGGDRKGAAEKLRAGEMVLRVEPGVRVGGRVADAVGAPVEGARVWSRTEPGRGSGMDEWTLAHGAVEDERTDAKGRYLLPAREPGLMDIFVEAEGHGPVARQVRLTAEQRGQVIEQDLTLARARDLVGRVVDDAGEPVAEAYVRLDRWRGRTDALRRVVRTDADGRFRLRDLANEEVEVSVHRPGFDPFRAAMIPGGEPLTVTLQRTPTVAGTVTDATTGKPVARFRVVPGSRNARALAPHFDYRNEYPEFTDGSYALTLLQVGRRTVVRIEAPGYRPVVSPPLDVAGQVRFDAELHSAPDVAGVVVDPEGQAVAGARVIAALPGSTIDLMGWKVSWNNLPFTETDSEGRFSLPPQTGRYGLVAVAEGGFARIDADGEDESEFRLTLRPWAKASGGIDLEAPDGPLRTVHVYAAGYRDWRDTGAHLRWHGSAIVDEQGRYLLEGVPDFEGRAMLLTFYGGGLGGDVRRTVPARFAAGETTRIDLLQDEAGTRTITGRLLPESRPDELEGGWARIHLIPAGLPSGAEAPEDPDEAIEAALPMYAAAASPDGGFRLHGVQPGRYVVRGRLEIDGRYFSSSTAVDVPEGDGPLDLGTFTLEAVPRVDEPPPNLPARLGLRFDDGSPILQREIGRPVVLLLYSLCDGNTPAMEDEIGQLTASLTASAEEQRLVLIALSADRIMCNMIGVPLRPGAVTRLPWQQAYLDPADDMWLRRLSPQVFPWVIVADRLGDIVYAGEDLEAAAEAAEAMLQEE